MLSFIRRALSSWVVLLLLGLLVVAFILTGVGDPFGSRGGVASGSLAKVGGANITEAEFTQSFERFMRRARETNPTATNAEAARHGAVEQVLEQLIRSKALEQFGRKQGVSISTRAVDGQIASIPAFQSGGKFDDATFRRLLAEQRLSESQLREGISGDAIRSQLLQNIALGAHVPQALVAPYASLLLETRTGSVAAVPATAAIPAPTGAQLDAFYKAHLKVYTVPDRKGFRYALLTQDIAMAGIVIGDDEIKRYYDEHQDLYGGIEQRQLLQAVVPSQDVATKIAARVKAGEPFAKVAAELAHFAATDLDVGTINEKRFGESTSPAVAKAVFGAPANSVVGPIKSDFGWHIVQVSKIIPSPKRSLADVRGEVVAKLHDERAQDALSDAVAKIQDGFDDGQSFGDVAKAKKLAIVDVPPVTRDGTTPDSAYRLDPKFKTLLTQAFDPDNAQQPTVQEIDKQTFALLEVADSVPATPIPLAKIRDAVAANWAAVERMNRAKAIADAVVADVAKGKPLAGALAERGLRPAQTANVRRLDIGQGKITPAIAALFTLPEHGVRAIPAPNGAGWLIVRVDTVTPGNPATAPGIVQATRSQIVTATPDEIAGQFVSAVEREVGVKRDLAAIARVRARYAGEGDLTKQ